MSVARIESVLKNEQIDPLTIAQNVVKKMKSEITSSNDVIPRAHNPFFFAADVSTYVDKFGIEKVENFIAHEIKTRAVRQKAIELMNALPKNTPAPVTTTQVAITLCGIGECSETSNRAMIELLKAGCKLPINIIGTKGKPKVPIPASPADFYDHAFVIIGNCENLDSDLNGLSRLDEKNVLLDPSLGIIGKAKETQILLSEIFKVYGIKTISSLVLIRPEIEGKMADVIFQNAKLMSDQIKTELHLSIVSNHEGNDEKNKFKKTDEVQCRINSSFFSHLSASDKISFENLETKLSLIRRR